MLITDAKKKAALSFAAAMDPLALAEAGHENERQLQQLTPAFSHLLAQGSSDSAERTAAV